MTSRSHTTDRELFLILITLLLLAFATQFSKASDASVEAGLGTPTAGIHPTPGAWEAAANPYWAPAHAFQRRSSPVYSDAIAELASNASQE